MNIFSTIAEVQAECDRLESELRSRGYSRVDVEFRVDGSSDYKQFQFRLQGYLEGMDGVYEYAAAETMEELEVRVAEVLAENFPAEAEARKRKFNEAMAKIAELADQIGEATYVNFAETLRDHLRNNLLEAPRGSEITVRDQYGL